MIRMSVPKVRVLDAMLGDPTRPHYWYELMRSTGVKSGSLYPILEQLERANWVEGTWEQFNNAQPGRPPRRCYRLTGLGQQAAPPAIAEYLKDLPAPGWAALS